MCDWQITPLNPGGRVKTFEGSHDWADAHDFIAVRQLDVEAEPIPTFSHGLRLIDVRDYLNPFIHESRQFNVTPLSDKSVIIDHLEEKDYVYEEREVAQFHPLPSRTVGEITIYGRGNTTKQQEKMKHVNKWSVNYIKEQTNFGYEVWEYYDGQSGFGSGMSAVRTAALVTAHEELRQRVSDGATPSRAINDMSNRTNWSYHVVGYIAAYLAEFAQDEFNDEFIERCRQVAEAEEYEYEPPRDEVGDIEFPVENWGQMARYSRRVVEQMRIREVPDEEIAEAMDEVTNMRSFYHGLSETNTVDAAITFSKFGGSLPARMMSGVLPPEDWEEEDPENIQELTCLGCSTTSYVVETENGVQARSERGGTADYYGCYHVGSGMGTPTVTVYTDDEEVTDYSDAVCSECRGSAGARGRKEWYFVGDSAYEAMVNRPLVLESVDNGDQLRDRPEVEQATIVDLVQEANTIVLECTNGAAQGEILDTVINGDPGFEHSVAVKGSEGSMSIWVLAKRDNFGAVREAKEFLEVHTEEPATAMAA